MEQPLLVGVTGGIGSGKSTVASIFSVLGIPTYNADAWAKTLMTTKAKLKKDLISAFGKDSYEVSGALNRAYLAQRIFSDEEEREKMDHLVHPHVKEHFKRWSKKQQGHPYVIKEAALLLTPEKTHELDEYIVVTAPEQLRMKRIRKRDPFRTTKDIQSILSGQVSEKVITDLADYIVVNDEHQPILPQILYLHVQFMLQVTEP